MYLYVIESVLICPIGALDTETTLFWIVHILSFRTPSGPKVNFRLINEAYCKDYGIVNGHHCIMGRPSTNFCSSTQPYVVATYIFYCVFRMLRFVDGWSWSNAISNLSSRSYPVTAGHCGSQRISEAKRS